MSNADAQPGAGNIDFELDGKPMVLTPSAGACLTISRLHGGLTAAVQRCAAFDADTISAVLAAGLGLNPRAAMALPDAIYRTGLIGLSGPCIEFIHIVGNGGRPLAQDDDGEGDEEPDPQLPAFP